MNYTRPPTAENADRDEKLNGEETRKRNDLKPMEIDNINADIPLEEANVEGNSKSDDLQEEIIKEEDKDVEMNVENFEFESEDAKLNRKDAKMIAEEPANDGVGSEEIQDEKINTVWSKDVFNKKAKPNEINLNNNISWKSRNDAEVKGNNDDDGDEEDDDAEDDEEEEEEEEDAKETSKDGAKDEPNCIGVEEESNSPAHHARRPMNAFLIFCKKHRPIVRKKYPNLENRGVTRYLGEWWALLDGMDKEPYIKLAKDYKDAFFSANPDFKWYKLPAPPLRTLTTRPGSGQKEPLPPQSPTAPNNHHSHQAESEFTPGKLADESQLGNLTSLMQTTFNKTPEGENPERRNDYANNNLDGSLESPTNVLAEATAPPKPFKKRKLAPDVDPVANKIVKRDIFDVKGGSNASDGEPNQISEYANQNHVPHNGNATNSEPRKSERSCKGLKYIEFMANGKLLRNKRERHAHEVTRRDEDKPDVKAEQKLDLQQTIRRLAERTNKIVPEMEAKPRRVYTNSESSEENFPKYDFNLEERISNLPILNYDVYMQRKRDSKKKKMTKARNEPKHKVQNMASNINNNNILIGSQKRKNKQSITHLEMKDSNSNDSQPVNNNLTPTDLSGLATLAEIAAISQKIN